MKKIIVSLLILSSLSAFVYKVNSKSLQNITVNIKTQNGVIINTGNTDKKGKFTINISEKGNFNLAISSDELLKALTQIDHRAKEEKHYVITLVVEAESNTWTVDTKNNVTHQHKVKKNSSYEIKQSVTIRNGILTGWSESMIDIVSKGNAKIKGKVSFHKR